MNKPFRAYNGDESYVFICYAHLDSDTVYSDLIQIDQSGIHVWYDEGIPAGTSWRGEIATAIKGASKFLFFVSAASLKSSHCLREVDFALNNEIEIIPIYLDDSSLPGELELALSRVQALFRERDSMYMQHLLGGLQQNTPFAPLLTLVKKKGLRKWLTILAFGFGILIIVVWTQKESFINDVIITQSSIAIPNSYDVYLEGLELLDRWDKDGNLDTAIELFREASTLDPTFALSFARLAEGLRIRYVLTGEDTWLDEASDSVDEALSLNANLAPVQVVLGNIQATKGNFDLAFAALERALAIDANDAGANQAIAKLYARLGRLEDADASYKKALALNPENLTILNSYANFLYYQSRFDEAINYWQIVIRLAPEHYAALVNLGSVLEKTGRSAEAITMYQRSIEIRPTYMAYSNLGTAYSRSERFPAAVEAYQQALEIDDSNWLAWGNLAYVYSWINGMNSKATETFEHAIQLAEKERQQSPREPFVHSDLALYYAKTQKAELALQRIETAIALSPETAEILAAAAETYEIIGQRDKAVEFARRALALDMSMQQLQRNPELTKLLTDPRITSIP